MKLPRRYYLSSFRCSYWSQVLHGHESIAVSSGGVAEIFETDDSGSGDEEVIVLRSRKGIVRLALQTGAALVPCYVFGNNRLLRLWAGGKGRLHELLRWLSRKIGKAVVGAL